MPEYIDKEAFKEKYLCFGYLPEMSEKEFDSFPTKMSPPVRHGKWELRGGRLYCSVCKERACVTRDMEDFWYAKGTDYCPKCGAKMDNADEE